MSEAFSLVADRMPRRQITPFAIRMAAMLTVIAVLLTGFVVFVVSAQRSADARRATLEANERAEAEAELQAALRGTNPDQAPTVSAGAVSDILNVQAQHAAEDVLAASRLVDGPTIDVASLSAVNHDLLFVDGPSTAPSVVSVYQADAGWAAAVHGADETCFWVAVGAAGTVRYGTGTECTGMAALAADRPRW